MKPDENKRDNKRLRNWIQRVIKVLTSWEERLKPEELQTNTDFNDLAPTDDADECGTYSNALNFATSSHSIRNIALTGPYGSGKSSVIKTYLKQYKGSPLQISLAAFSDEGSQGSDGQGAEEKKSKQDIERSILQQMIYSTDASELPYSRFKRIETPSRLSIIVPVVALLAILSFWYLFENKSDLISGEFFKPLNKSNWFNYTTAAIGVLALCYVLRRFYHLSFGYSLKGISLKNLEITPHAVNENSILNRHLDEIIYFFQKTNHDLVVFEDLDRFENKEIFVTLREINRLINSNASIERPVRFLYALRDDMFRDTERTKFFEFIVPVVPIINYSNSVDKVKELSQTLTLHGSLNPQFLRDVSRYLNDLRLIRNIFNEYSIYSAKLGVGTNTLEPNNLLAILIYKNVVPEDFEKLHEKTGAFYELLSMRDQFVVETQQANQAKIHEIEEYVKSAEAQLPTDLAELRKIYAMALLEMLPSSHAYLFLGSRAVPFGALSQDQEFERIFSQKSLRSSVNINHGGNNTDVSGLEREVDQNRTYEDRKLLIQQKSEEGLEEARRAIDVLKTTNSTLRVARFSEIARANNEETAKCLSTLGKYSELIQYLVLEGHLDDSYYQYISLFHSVHLSQKDNQFLMKIRSYSNPEPEFEIDNPATVVGEMRQSDFGQPYVLNRRIFDYLLLQNSPSNRVKLNYALKFISENFSDCESFFEDYFIHGERSRELIVELYNTWPEFPEAAVRSSLAAGFVARLLAFVSDNKLKRPPFKDGPIVEFFSKNTHEVLSEGVEISNDRIRSAEPLIEDLEAISNHTALVQFAMEKGYYRVNDGNINFVLQREFGANVRIELRKRNLTTVLSSQNQRLRNKVESNFEDYLSNTLSKIEGNNFEEQNAIVYALEQSSLSDELFYPIWKKQTVQLSSLHDIQEHHYRFALAEFRVIPSWSNCIIFIGSSQFSKETLVNYLSDRQVIESLNTEVPSTDEGLALRKFLLSANELSNDVYRLYVSRLPLEFNAFPEDLAADKIGIVVEERKISFTPESFGSLDGMFDHQLSFIANNIDRYLENSASYSVSEEVLLELLDSYITDEQKLRVLSEISPAELAKLPAKSALVSSLIWRTSYDATKLGYDFVKLIILNSETEKVRMGLLIKHVAQLSSDQVRDLLDECGSPFSGLTEPNLVRRLPFSSDARDLLVELENMGEISSWKQVNSGTELQVFGFRKKHGG